MTNEQYIKECATVIKLDKFKAEKEAKKAELLKIAKEKAHLDGDHDVETKEAKKEESSAIDELDMELGESEPPVSEAREDNELEMDLSEIDEIEADSEW